MVMNFFNSAWSEPTDIRRNSVKMVLSLAPLSGLLEEPIKFGGAQWTHWLGRLNFSFLCQ
jgi:hypothetical protein